LPTNASTYFAPPEVTKKKTILSNRNQKFDTVQGPLWRVQLITEASMDLANLGFGPELQAILEDDEPQVIFFLSIFFFDVWSFSLLAIP
jgi:hypothetical protein